MITLDQQIISVKREIRMREHVYPKWVNAGKMELDNAEHEIAAMKAVLETLERARNSALITRMLDGE